MNKELRDKLKQNRVRYRELVLSQPNINKNDQKLNTGTMEYSVSMQQPIGSSSANNELSLLENGFKGISKDQKNLEKNEDLNFDSIQSLYKPIQQHQPNTTIDTNKPQNTQKSGQLTMNAINRKIAKLKKKQKQKRNVKDIGSSQSSLLQKLNQRFQEQKKRDSDSLFDVTRLEKGKSSLMKSQEAKTESEKLFMMKFLKGQ